MLKTYTAKQGRLKKSVSQQLQISFNTINKLLRNKDIKVNGKRVNDDVLLNDGDIVDVYLPKTAVLPLDIVFQDQNVVVVDKRSGIETDELAAELKESIDSDVFACHRLDRNTTGLIIFAKNQLSYKVLTDAFKNRCVDKHYRMLCNGVFKNSSGVLRHYLKKDADKALVTISATKQNGYAEIVTEYKVTKQYDSYAEVLAKLVTGKTHQLRAHMAFIGHCVIGDGKYGDYEVNKQHKRKFQALISCQMSFNLDKDSPLSYLNDKTFKSRAEF